MFGLDMVSKENFLAYSTQFIFLVMRLVPGNVVMVAIDMCRKSPITGEWIYGITWKHVSAFMFFVYYLFVCLIIFLRFYICNVWFINGIFGSSHSRVLLKMVILYILGESPWWGPFPVELQELYVCRFSGGELLCGCYSSILFNFFFYLLCELLFFGELPLVAAS